MLKVSKEELRVEGFGHLSEVKEDVGGLFFDLVWFCMHIYVDI